jgi:hypothetical protein
MGLLDSIVAGVVTTVISALVLEFIRELRSKGTQPLERVFGFIATFVKGVGKGICLLVRWIRDLVEG